jgi:hypothetical protein
MRIGIMTKVVLWIWLFLFAANVHAAATTATIEGVVRDGEGGGAVPGVTITLTSASAQLILMKQTDMNGCYRFENLPPASDYIVTAELAGAKAVAKKRQALSAGQLVVKDFKLRFRTFDGCCWIVAKPRRPAAGTWPIEQRIVDKLPM